jgi:hypothetical protein
MRPLSVTDFCDWLELISETPNTLRQLLSGYQDWRVCHYNYGLQKNILTGNQLEFSGPPNKISLHLFLTLQPR